MSARNKENKKHLALGVGSGPVARTTTASLNAKADFKCRLYHYDTEKKVSVHVQNNQQLTWLVTIWIGIQKYGTRHCQGASEEQLSSLYRRRERDCVHRVDGCVPLARHVSGGL